MTLPVLYPFQKDGVRQIERFGGRALLAWDMGLGKTLGTLYWCKNYLDQWPAVIVAPAGFKTGWQREALNMVGMDGMILESHSPTRLPRSKLYIVNYDILGSWLKELKRIDPGFVGLDEAHMIGNRSTKRTKACKILCEDAEYVIAGTGTAIVNRPSELWPILNILRPDLYPSFFSYAARYCNPRKTPWGWKYDGATRLDELREDLLANVMIRCRKEDVLDDLPDKIRSYVPIPLSDPKEYAEAEDDFINWLTKTHPSKASNARKAERLTRMIYLRGLVGRLKIKGIQKWINDFLRAYDEKLICFGIHKEVLGTLASHYGNRAVKVDGSVSNKIRPATGISDRQELFDRFNEDADTDLLFANMKAAGTAWSCRSARTMAFLEIGWTSAEHDQAEDRIRGIKRGIEGMSPLYSYLIAQGTIDEHLCDIVSEKRGIAGAVLDGISPEEEDFKTFDELENRLLDKGRRKR